MSYTKETLLPNEKIIYYTKPHYIIFYKSLIWLIVAVLLITSFLGYSFFSLLILLIAVVDFIGDVISFYCSEYTITNKRILMKTGFIRRQSFDIFLNRLEGIYIEQSILGRILNFGTISVSGVGGSKNRFFYLPNPIEFHKQIQRIQKSPENHPIDGSGKSN